MVVDFHSHILPCCDHGSTSVEMSVSQVRSALNAGIDLIVATPHYYNNNDTIDDFLLRRKNCYQALVDALKTQGIEATIVLGAEVNLQTELLEKNERLKELCISGTRYMLIEPPMFSEWTDWVYNSIRKLRDFGIEPIIAHIDRYNEKHLKRLFENDYVYQINVSALTTFSGRRKINRFIKNNCVHVIGSDIHLNGPEYKHFYDAKKRFFGLFEFCGANAAEILNNKTIY